MQDNILQQNIIANNRTRHPTETKQYMQETRQNRISRLQTEMYQSGYHLTERIDTTPLKLNLSFLNKTDLDSIQEEELQAEETKEVENQEFPEYNYLME